MGKILNDRGLTADRGLPKLAVGKLGIWMALSVIASVIASVISSTLPFSAMANESHLEHSPDHHPSHPMEHSSEHPHSTLEIPEGEPVPTVQLQLYPDALRGWNLEMTVSHFRFSPESVNQPGQWNEGHAHLYLNGQKITRLYGNWYYLPELPAGDNEITVTLNTNEHQDLQHNGKTIGATVQIRID